MRRISIAIAALRLLCIHPGIGANNGAAAVEASKQDQPKPYANSRNDSKCLACHFQMDKL